MIYVFLCLDAALKNRFPRYHPLAGGCAERGVRLRGRRSIATGVGVSFLSSVVPEDRTGEAGRDGARCGFLDQYAATRGHRHPTRWPGRGYSARRSTPVSAPRVECASPEVTGDTPARGGRILRRVAAGIEFGPNLGRIWDEGDRGRSEEIGGDRRRWEEIDRDRPRSTDLRRPSLN